MLVCVKNKTAEPAPAFPHGNREGWHLRGLAAPVLCARLSSSVQQTRFPFPVGDKPLRRDSGHFTGRHGWQRPVPEPLRRRWEQNQQGLGAG